MTKQWNTEKPAKAASAAEVDRSRRYLRKIEGLIDKQISALNHSIRLYNHHLAIAEPEAHPKEVTVAGNVYMMDVRDFEKTFEEWKSSIMSLKLPGTSAETDELFIAVQAGSDDFLDAGGEDGTEAKVAKNI